MMDNVQEIFRTKSAAMSRLRRQEAEHLHKAGKIDKALLLFTQSVVRAPIASKLKYYQKYLYLTRIHSKFHIS